MNVLMVASEAAPFLRTGSPADVVVDLARQLRRQGHDARLIIPFYRNLNLSETERAGLRPVVPSLPVPLGAFERQAEIWRLGCPSDGHELLPIYFVRDQFYFSRENAYGYLDDYERFVFFTRAVIEMLRCPEFASESWQPEAIHGHDWIAGLIPFWLHHTYRTDEKLASTAFVYTLHNAGFPGQFGRRALAVAGLEELGIYGNLGESAGRINFMARGILAADAVNTVSPTHAQEVMHQDAFRSLHGAFAMSGTRLAGILNGLDYAHYNPALDKRIPAQFDKDTLNRRPENKRKLQETHHLEVRPDAPLLGMVSRLITDKGVGLLSRTLDQLVTEYGAQLVLLATPGDFEFREAFEAAASAHPGQVAVVFGYDESVARLIYAGSDIILVPSRREPCGLSQMIAMRYGAVPVVCKTGGLADTVQPWDGPAKLGKGFLFESFDASAFLQAVCQAVTLYKENPTEWQRLQKYNLGVDFSWEKPALQYERLYANARQAVIVRTTAASPTGPSQPASHVNAPQAIIRTALPMGDVLPEPRDALLVEAVLMANQLAAFIPPEGSGTGDRLKEYLKQVARRVRGLLPSDAVLLWTADSSTPHTLRIGETSFARENQPVPSEEDLKTCRFYSAEVARTWSRDYVYRRDAGGESLLGQSGFLNSPLASKQGWNVQLSVPIIAQGATLGQIDVFCRDSARIFDEWERGAVEAIANTVAVNFDRIGLAERNTRLLAAHRKMSEVESVEDVARVLLREARLLTHGDDAWLDLEGGASYGLDSVNRFTLIASTCDRPQAPGQLIRADLREDRDPPVGVLAVRKAAPRAFSREDETTLACFARQAAGLVRIAQQRQQRDKGRVQQLERLANSLTAGVDFGTLLQRVIDTIADVLEVRAAALYLVGDDPSWLIIRAAYGYQKPLLEAKITYRVTEDEGLTGWIAKTGKIALENSLDALHRHPGWKGKKNKEHNVREPNAFLGVPLSITETTGAKCVIGVLKVEDRKESCAKTVFDQEDKQLAEMMANVIATVVYNSKLGEQRLAELSQNLGRLSSALAGSLDGRSLMEKIVDTLGEVLGVDAASLYLADEKHEQLHIQAAFGYQKPLVEAKASYPWGKGVTGRIAERNEEFWANSLDELRKHGDGKPGRYDHLHIGGAVPSSFYALPLNVRGENRPIGVLKVESVQDRRFANQDVQLLRMMANVIATVVYNSKLGEQRLQELSQKLGRLSGAVAGSQDSQTLMDNIVETIGQVLSVDAASLYLADEKREWLHIQAAFGYQKPLVEAKACYPWGEGVTGKIAQANQELVANSLAELRQHGGGKRGRYDHLHLIEKVPRSFFALPLNVRGENRPIGVLKVESVQDRRFTNQDVQLLRMMANVVATVVYNSKLGEQRLQELSQKLGRLSGALAGSQDSQTLMDNIVETIGVVLTVDAASLYLADEQRRMLTIQAAYGYQKPLVEAKAQYDWGEGVTGRIAETNEEFGANSLADLRKHGGGKPGKYDHLQKGNVPQSYYALPLNVHGQVKPIGVLKVESLRDRGFNNQDVLLLRMMANVIATVVYNAQLDRVRLARIIAALGSISKPSAEAAPSLLMEFCRTSERGTLGLVASAISSNLDGAPEKAMTEAIALLNLKASRDLYSHIANASSDLGVRRRFTLLYQALRDEQIHPANLEKVFAITDSWVQLEEIDEVQHRLPLVDKLVRTLAQECRAEVKSQIQMGQWAGYLLSTGRSFEESYLPEQLPLAFHSTGEPDDSDLADLRRLLADDFNGSTQVLLPLICTPEHLADVRAKLRSKVQQPFAIDTVVLTVDDFQQIVGATRPNLALQKAVLAQINLLSVSPYEIAGPARRLFFGREGELRTICDRAGESSFAVVGGRKIGKTSILHQLHYVRLSNSRKVRTILQGCLDIHHRDQFLATEVSEWHSPDKTAPPAKLGELLQNPPADPPTLLLLDEVDTLVQNDGRAGWPLFNQLRNLSNERRLQVVLSGELTLIQAIRDATSPLYNFVETLRLGPLERLAVREIVVEPMRKLEIKLVADNDIVERVFAFTSGHPNLVQQLCRQLVEQVNLKENRTISLSDLEAVLSDQEFQTVFIRTYLERAAPLEWIITLLLIRHGKHCGLDALMELLRAQHIETQPEQAQAALDALVDIRSILRLFPDGYGFAVQTFPQLLVDGVVLKDLLLVEKDRFRRITV